MSVVVQGGLALASVVLITYSLFSTDDVKKTFPDLVLEKESMEVMEEEIEVVEDKVIVQIEEEKKSSLKPSIHKEFVEKEIVYEDSFKDVSMIKEEYITQYLEKESLKNITSTQSDLENPDYIIPRFSVYSDITKEDALEKKDSSLPPIAPSIVTGSFYSGVQFTVIIDSNINREASNIIISNNYPDGTIEEIVKLNIKTSEDYESSIVTPPMITIISKAKPKKSDH